MGSRWYTREEHGTLSRSPVLTFQLQFLTRDQNQKFSLVCIKRNRDEKCESGNSSSGMSTQSESIRRTARQLQQRVMHLSGSGPPPPAAPTPVPAPVPPPVVPAPAEATFSQPAIMAVLQTLSDENEALQLRCHDLNLMRMEVATICCA